MKRISILLTLFLICANSYSKEIMICGTYKLTGYFNDGSAYSGTINVTKTDNGIAVKGAINEYLSDTGGANTTGCAFYVGKSFLSISFCADGSISMNNLKIVTKDLLGNWVIKDVQDVQVKRV
jgi:hypothetical protein